MYVLWNKINPDLVLKISVFLCFMILLILQYKLVSSSYEIENREIAKNGRLDIKRLYEGAIINDKLFPGGQKIIDHYLNRDSIVSLEYIYRNDKEEFGRRQTELMTSIIRDLQSGSNLDSLFTEFFSKIELKRENYKYALVLDNISISFDGQNYIEIIDVEHDPSKGLIDGDAEAILPENMISPISISTPAAYSSRVKFTLFGLSLSQKNQVVKKIAPLFLLSGVSILIIAMTFVSTFKNWQKQKKLNEMSTDFLNSITHEFKTPLASIQVSVKNVQRETKDIGNEQVSQSIHVIHRQSKRLNDLVDQAIGISAFNPNQLKKERRNLVEDLENIVYDLQLKYIQDTGVDILMETEETELMVSYDPFFFTTTINNIIENAIKHNSAAKKEVSVLAGVYDKNIHLEIMDNGEGFGTKELKLVFQKFYQGSRGRKKGGLGLGLYYVDQMIQAHGWFIEIKNKKRRGSRVHIRIPIK